MAKQLKREYVEGNYIYGEYTEGPDYIIGYLDKDNAWHYYDVPIPIPGKGTANPFGNAESAPRKFRSDWNQRQYDAYQKRNNEVQSRNGRSPDFATLLHQQNQKILGGAGIQMHQHSQRVLGGVGNLLTRLQQQKFNNNRNGMNIANPLFNLLMDNDEMGAQDSSKSRQPTLEDKHYNFYSTIAIQIYTEGKNRGFSPYAMLVVISQGAIESGYGTSKGAKINNFFGIMGGNSSIKTTHGILKSFDSPQKGINAYFDLLQSRWPSTLPLYRKNNFISDELNKALNSGKYEKYPAYFVRDTKHNYDYGENILDKVMPNSTKRFIQSLEKKIESLQIQSYILEKKIGYDKIMGRRLGIYSIPLSKEEIEYYEIKKNIQEIDTILNEIKDYE